MKKIIMIVAAMLTLTAPATMAQKISADSYKSKIEKSNEAIQNEKKAAKASTWITRGNAYLDALQAPTENLFAGMDVAMLKITCGEPKTSATEEIKGTTYETLGYNYFTAYILDGKVVGWKNKKEILKGSGDVAYESFVKAYELDPNQASKIKDGVDKLINYYAQIGDIANSLSDYETGADAYIKVYEIQEHPVSNNANSMMLYYAGYMYTIGANENPALYSKGVDVLNRAIEAGYPEEELKDTETDDAEKGNIFYYLYHCYYGQKDADATNIQNAKGALVKGVEMFPKNQRIIDALTQLYTTEEGVGDPSELIGMIDGAIESDPGNADLWYARGRVYFALKDYDNCIESFTKVTEIAPEVFDGYFYLGLFYIYKGDALNEEISNKTYTENAAYKADIDKTNAVYSAAIPILERAHELRPDDLATVEYLKSLCFRLRDEDGIMDKYNQYNDLFNEMKDNQ
ncbi:MAG: tetratricopeptide repeat protein [Rikenellaceae bacterium]